MAKIIKFKEANLKQISFWILGTVAMLALLLVALCSIIPWEWRALASAVFAVSALQLVKTAANP